MNHPPHLPERTTEKKALFVDTRGMHMLLVAIILSTASGIVGALMVFAWVLPAGYMSEGQWIPRGQSQTITSPFIEPDTTIVRKVKNTAVDVFFDSEILPNGYYSSSALIGEGVMLSSNGWGVVFAPELTELVSLPKLRIRDVQGTWYTPTLTTSDKKNGLIYFKLEGTEFYVVSFPDWRVLQEGTSVWVYERGVWKRQALGSLTRISEEQVFRASDERQRFKLSPEGLSERGLVVSDTGSLLGFIDAEGHLEDAWSLEHSIPQLLESGVVVPPSVDWTGSMVETLEEGRVVKGYVLESIGVSHAEGLKRFDIIRAINGVPVSEYTLHRSVVEFPVTLSIWRSSGLSDILVP